MIDCFMYCNEAALLGLRLECGMPHVDRFIIIDATETHRGHEKAHSLDTDILERYGDKIVYDCVVFPDALAIHPEQMTPAEVAETAWKREHYQRSRIVDHLAGEPQDELCLITDLDEIPYYEGLLATIDRHGLDDQIVKYLLPTYVYNVHFFQARYAPRNAVTMPIRALDGVDVNWVRFKKDDNYFDDPSLFRHFNRFLAPHELFDKEHSMVEGDDMRPFEMADKREYTRRIMNGDWHGAGGLVEVDHEMPANIGLLHQVHTMEPAALRAEYAQVAGDDDDTFDAWYEEFFGPETEEYDT